MKKRMMADVLWKAANVHLTHGDANSFCKWSCNAALKAENPRLITDYGIDNYKRKASATDKFLTSLGCQSGGHVGKFRNYPEGAARQGVRYLWLMLAMHVAKDEKVTL